MAFWASLFGNSKTVEVAANGISNSLDKIFYTDEEKSDAQQLGFEAWIRYQEATAPQNVARRLIALIIVGLFALLSLMAVIIYPFNIQYSNFIQSILSASVMPLTVVIVSFYFYKRIKE